MLDYRSVHLFKMVDVTMAILLLESTSNDVDSVGIGKCEKETPFCKTYSLLIIVPSLPKGVFTILSGVSSPHISN